MAGAEQWCKVGNAEKFMVDMAKHGQWPNSALINPQTCEILQHAQHMPQICIQMKVGLHQFEHTHKQVLTSSSAVAKRPCDALCLSVVSFNSTKRPVESFIVSYVGDIFITACCLWCNVETSCHKHFVVVSRHQLTLPLATSDKCHNLQDCGPADVLVKPGQSQLW